ncbi:MAG TPA: hypothetical protein VGW36_01070 [Pyrinomonadaceae bacterium]|nr:hypothetical protein [Pyrinomonadaceae bacterium]
MTAHSELRISSRVNTNIRFQVAAWHDGETVGFHVVVVKGMRGALDDDMELISDDVYRDGVQFLRSGPESDARASR